MTGAGATGAATAPCPDVPGPPATPNTMLSDSDEDESFLEDMMLFFK
jgi:hypothetical protein